VYSFGVLLFELFSYGGVPWHNLNNARVSEEVIAGRQLTPPDETPSEVATLMKSCWSMQPEHRPSFKVCCSLYTHLTLYLGYSHGYEYIMEITANSSTRFKSHSN
jgi:hypothetical protein